MLLQNQVLNETYQILQPLGSGGTSSVYLGYHLRLRKYVAVKQLKGSFSTDFLMRTEVDILKDLHHSNLPQVYDFLQEGERVYTVIDYVDGYDLEAYIKSNTRLPESCLKRYLYQTAQVLDYLHGQRVPVIHSDIKPGNIIIDRDGNAILIDFNTSIGANQGNLLGLTLPYASPEQIQLAQYALCGQALPFALDGRADIYSLGATFYELISGIRPTPGVPPTPLRALGLYGYTDDFLALIDRMMVYDREKRMGSARRLMNALERLDNGYWTYFALRCVSLVLCAALIAGGLYCLLRGGQRETQEQYREQYETAVTLTAQGDLDGAEDVLDGILVSDSMQAYLRKTTAEQARLYHAMGDISYYRDQYGTAATYYRYAVDRMELTDIETCIAYLRDCAIAYAQSGELDAARAILAQAQSLGTSDETLRMISVVIDAYSGDFDSCAASARELIASCTDSGICLRTALAVASAAEELDTRIQWLELAAAYDTGKNAVRGLAAAYGEKAQNTVGQEKNAALQKAQALYEQLCGNLYASSNDMLNYSVILRMAGKANQAAEILKTALERDGQNYQILANLSFICYEQGDEAAAADWCGRAIRAWNADNSADKLSENDPLIQDLLELGHRFGIGET